MAKGKQKAKNTLKQSKDGWADSVITYENDGRLAVRTPKGFYNPSRGRKSSKRARLLNKRLKREWKESEKDERRIKRAILNWLKK